MMRDEPEAGANGVTRAGDDVRRTLRDLCDNARSNHVRVEQIVIAIKQGWSSLHSEHPRTRAAGPDVMLNQVVTLCIDEYYAEREHS